MGQNKSHRRWQKFESSKFTPIPANEIETEDNTLTDTLEQINIPVPETESSVLDSIPLREVSNDVVVETINGKYVSSVETKPSLQPDILLTSLNESHHLPEIISNNSPNSHDINSPGGLISNQSEMKERRRIHKLVKKLRDPKMLTNLIKNLDKHRLTKDFVYSIQKMAGGDHPMDSIPHSSHLESI